MSVKDNHNVDNMNIIFFIPVQLKGRQSGEAVHVQELFRELSSFIEVNIVENNINFLSNIRIINKYMGILYCLLYGIYIFLKKKPKLIYARSGQTLLSLILAVFLRIPLVVEVNGLILFESKLKKGNKKGLLERIGFFFKSVNEKMIIHADHIIAVTEDIKKYLEKKYSIPSKKITVIQNGANVDLYKPMNKDEVIKEFNFERKYSYVGFIGSFKNWHGINDLVKSVPLILRKKKDVKFVLVGDGELKREIIQMVKELKIDQNFIFLDRISYEKVPTIINIFDVCVILKHREISGSPLKLWEYLACGKPVVATNTNDFRVLEDANAGILVDPEKPQEVAKAIITLLNNKKLRTEMGRNGRKFMVENRSWESVAREINTVIRKIIEDNKKA